MRHAKLALALAAFAAGACTSSDDPAPGPEPTTFAQSDLVGTWDRVGIQSNATPGWFFHTMTIDAAGLATFDACVTPGGTCTGPTGVTFHLDAAGTLYASGSSANPSLHGRMTSGKSLIFAIASLPGTGTPTASTLQVFRRRAPGVTFSAADVASFPFVLHSLHTGAGTNWERGGGTTDGSGTITETWCELSTGPCTPPASGFDALQVDANGLVTLAGDPSFHGVMTADKSAIFAVTTTMVGPPAEYSILAILRAAGSFAQADLADHWAFHMLTSGTTAPTSPWMYGTFGIDGTGSVAFESAMAPSGAASPAGFTILLDGTGDIARPDLASYRGRMSCGKDFFVRTQTLNGANSFAIGAR